MPDKQVSDEELVRAWLAGDGDAGQRLLARYYRALMDRARAENIPPALLGGFIGDILAQSYRRLLTRGNVPVREFLFGVAQSEIELRKEMLRLGAPPPSIESLRVRRNIRLTLNAARGVLQGDSDLIIAFDSTGILFTIRNHQVQPMVETRDGHFSLNEDLAFAQVKAA